MQQKKLVKSIAVISAVSLALLSSIVGAGAAVIDDGALSAIEIQTLDSANSSSKALLKASTLPSSYSSKDLGYVTEVQTQKYNDCWTYAGLGAYESKLLSSGISVGQMSSDHLNLWATTRLNGTGWQRNISGGGYAEIPVGYLTSWQGGVESSVIGSVDMSGSTNGDDLQTDLTQYGVTELEYLDNNDDAVKNAIMENGGVYGSFGYAASCYNNSQTAYYMPESYSASYTGHAVEIVGWNDNYSKNIFKAVNGETPQSNGAWLCKGSWGSDFNSLDGYFWVSYEDKYFLSETYSICYTIRDYTEITSEMKLEQNEIYGATYNFDYISSSNIVYINRFDFSNGYNTLDKVIFETSSIGSDYSIYYIPAESSTGSIASDKSSWTKLCEGVVEYNGYICADIDDFTLPLGYGAIGIEIDTSDINSGISQSDSGYIKNTLGVGEWLKNSAKITFLNDTSQGDSYIYYDDSLYELLDWYKDNNNDDNGGTFVIKALTTGDGASISMLGDVDLNGTISVADATLLQKYIVGNVSLTDVRALNADVDGNGVLNISDATEIQKMVVGG